MLPMMHRQGRLLRASQWRQKRDRTTSVEWRKERWFVIERKPRGRGYSF